MSYVVSTSANPSGSGTFSVTSSSLNNYVVTPTPSSNYQFVNWLVDGYTQLEYIESSGTQYIDTGFSSSSGIEFEQETSFNDVTQAPMLFGVTKYVPFQYVNSQSGIRYCYNGVWSSYTTHQLNNNTKYKIYAKVIDGTQLIKIDDTNVVNTTSSITIGASGNYCLFKRSSYYSYKLYTCKIWDNGTLIRDFIPCIRHSDGQIGLLDKVNWKFYGNSGSGVFSGGSLND